MHNLPNLARSFYLIVSNKRKCFNFNKATIITAY